MNERTLEQLVPLLDVAHAAGITFLTLRALQASDPQWLEKLAALDNATRATNGDPRVPRTVADMRERLIELALDPDACFIACAGDQWVGYTVLDTARGSPERLHQSWTGVLPSHRRRGIASALKVLTVRYALEHGYEVIATEPRATNIASQALNRRIGFRPPSPTFLSP